MRVALVGKDIQSVEKIFSRHGLTRDDDHPDVVISVGGDGTLLLAERHYPGVPKLPLRKSRTSRKTHRLKTDVLLDYLAAGKLLEIPHTKLQVVHGRKKILALNDVIFHNELVTSAVRYRVAINGKDHGGDIIGDGLIVATPFGSTAYYRSITHSFFQVGIGLAFNNSIEPVDHLVLRDDSVIRVTVVRGPALVAADNNPDYFHLQVGGVVTVRKADHAALILAVPDGGD